VRPVTRMPVDAQNGDNLRPMPHLVGANMDHDLARTRGPFPGRERRETVDEVQISLARGRQSAREQRMGTLPEREQAIKIANIKGLDGGHRQPEQALGITQIDREHVVDLRAHRGPRSPAHPHAQSQGMDAEPSMPAITLRPIPDEQGWRVGSLMLGLHWDPETWIDSRSGQGRKEQDTLGKFYR
jgi:hypothetical protein